MSRMSGHCVAAALLSLAAWAGESPRIQPPDRLSQTGFSDPRNLAYSPQYPLWSDGAVKSRWIFLPPGAAIDVSDPAAWVFPVGTKLWKEFAFNGRKVETRMIWRATPDTWVYASYVWNDEQTEALRAQDIGVQDHVAIAPGTFHSIPGIADCKNCHESAPAPVLGFNALQLSDDRDPLAPHGEALAPGMVTLASLVADGLLAPNRPDFITSPPRIAAASPRERAVLGYFAGNCGHCHNSAGPLARVGLVLAHDPAVPAWVATDLTLTSLIDRQGRFQVPGVSDGTSRLVAPGFSDRSAVPYRMQSRRPASQMPPLGTVIADEEAVRLVKEWIAEDLVAGK